MRNNNLLKRGISAILTFCILILSLFIIGNSCRAETATDIIITPSSNQILQGETFTLTLFMTPAEPIGGWQFDLQFDQMRVRATTVTAGSNWTSYFDQGTINNTTGTITSIQTWTSGPYPAAPHIMCTITFTAIKTGLCDITIENVQVTNSSFTNITVVTHNITISIYEDNTENDHGNDGYFVDNNGDGVYDEYHNNETGNVTHVQKLGSGRYLIDRNGDGVWDTEYNPQTQKFNQYLPSQDNGPLMILGGILGIVAILFIFILLLTRKKKTESQTIQQEKSSAMQQPATKLRKTRKK